jgi:hypothetical protein
VAIGTSSHTPRLGLMRPVNADIFTPDDFRGSFDQIDQYPGVYLAADRDHLPSGWPPERHGMLAVEQDNGLLWQWYRPNTGAGIWRRITGGGLVGYVAGPAADMHTGATEGNGISVMNTTVTGRGVRPLSVRAYAGTVVNNDSSHGGHGVIYMALFVNQQLVKNGLVNSDPGAGTALQMDHLLVDTYNTFGNTLKISFNVRASGAGTVTVLAASHGDGMWIYEI